MSFDPAQPAPSSEETQELHPGLTWEQMAELKPFRTASRTVTEADLVTFVQWGGFNEPLFYDASHASGDGYSGRLCPGALVYCFAEGLVMQSLALHGTGMAFLGMDLRVTGPTYVGDTLHAVVEITSTRPTAKPGRGIVDSRVTVRNQRGDDVMVFTPLRMIRGNANDE